MWPREPGRRLAAGVLAVTLGAGCGGGSLDDQPRYGPLDASTFFEDGRSARPVVEGTVARGQLRTDAHRYTGQVDGAPARTLPFPVTAPILDRGRERYDIFCAPCHDRVGRGDGMVVRRGFDRPPSFHQARLREAPIGYFFDVMTRGFGAMSSYAHLVPPEDRWAIAVYVRALQFSQWAPLAAVPDAIRTELEASREVTR